MDKLQPSEEITKEEFERFGPAVASFLDSDVGKLVRRFIELRKGAVYERGTMSDAPRELFKGMILGMDLVFETLEKVAAQYEEMKEQAEIERLIEETRKGAGSGIPGLF